MEDNRRFTVKLILRTLVCIIAIAVFGCSNVTGISRDDGKDSKDTKTVNTTPSYDPYIEDDSFCEPCTINLFNVENEDIFGTGYYGTEVEFEYAQEQDVTFCRYWNSDINWYVYVFDEEFKGSLEELQDKTPALVNEGNLDLTEGQWVYVYCDCNSGTADEPTDGYYQASYWGA